MGAESEVIEKFPDNSKKIFLNHDAIDTFRDGKSLIIPGTNEKSKVDKVLYATGITGRICPQKRSSSGQ